MDEDEDGEDEDGEDEDGEDEDDGEVGGEDDTGSVANFVVS